ncbi:MAG: DUF2339 domain-containing protein [Mariprofundales bacterium]
MKKTSELSQDCTQINTNLTRMEMMANNLLRNIRQIRLRVSDLEQRESNANAALKIQLHDLEERYATLLQTTNTEPTATPQQDTQILQEIIPDHSPVLEINNNNITVVVEESITDEGRTEEVRTEEVRTESVFLKILVDYWSLILSLFAPFSQLLSRFAIFSDFASQIWEIFNKYRQQGKTAEFLLTVSGILLLVLGFAYMLQESFTNLTIVWKLICGFIIAASVVYLGIWLHKNKEEMRDYAAAIIGLGIILAYLCAYFLGTSVGLAPSWFAFALLAILTAIAYGLALIFSTRIVALVSLIGGACLPLLGAGDTWLLTVVYPSYLLLLNLSSLHLAHKIRWSQLAYIAFALSAAMLEYQFSQDSNGDIYGLEMAWLLLVLHAFYYLYLVYSYRLLRTASKTTALALMTTNLLLFLSLLPQVLDENMTLLGWCFIANSLLLAIVFFQQMRNGSGEQEAKQRNAMLILQAGIFLSVAIISWVDARWMSLFWSMEAVLLLYIGLIFRLRSIRGEAYAIIFIALIQAAWQALPLTNETFLLLISIGVILTASVWLLVRDQDYLEGHEVKIISILREAYSAWLIIAVVTSAHLFTSNDGMYPVSALSMLPFFLGDYVYLLVSWPLIMILLRRSSRFELPITETAAWLLGTFPIILLLISAQTAGSLLFFNLNWAGKLAYLEIFSLLWLIANFYMHNAQNSRWSSVALPLHSLFYLLIPICFLSGVWHKAYSWFPAFLWLSAFISFGLWSWKKYTALYYEQRLLAFFASVFSIFAVIMSGSDDHLQIITALLSGLIYFVIVLFVMPRFICFLSLSKQYIPVTSACSYTACCCFALAADAFNLFVAGIFCMQFYICYLLWRLPTVSALHNQLGLWFMIALLMPFASLIEISFGKLDFIASLFVIASVLLQLLLVHIKRRHFPLLWRYFGSYASKLISAHLSLFFLYTILLYYWFDNIFQAAWLVALVLHATLMLFESLWPRYVVLLRASIVMYAMIAIKIIFYDIYDLIMMEKIMAFMVIGSFLLLSSYCYQRLKVRLRDLMN